MERWRGWFAPTRRAKPRGRGGSKERTRKLRRCYSTQGRFWPALFRPRFGLNTPPPNEERASRTPSQPGHQSPRKKKQLSSRHDAAQYHEPRIGDSAHVQCRTSLCSLPASNACAPHTVHERNACVYSADAASRFQPLRWRHLWCRSRVRAVAARARRAQHQRARRAHALDAAPVIVWFKARARADVLLHDGGRTRAVR